MIIRRIRVDRVGCLDHLEVLFAPGLSVIKGPNEAGKSTLHQALLMALLERPSRKKANEAYRSWGSDQLFELEVEYEWDGRIWTLIKDFEAYAAELRRDDGERTASWEDIQEHVSTVLGTSSPKVFRSTMCVAQDELANVSEGEKEIAHSLEEIVTGGEDDVHTASAITQLEKAIQDHARGYTTPAPRNPGQLARFAQQSHELQALVADSRTAVQRLDEAQERLIEIGVRLEEIELELNPRLATRDLADSAGRLLSDLRAWRDKESSLEITLERIKKAEEEIAQANRLLVSLGPLAALPEADANDLMRLNERVLLLGKQREAAKAVANQLEPTVGKRVRLPVWAMGAAALVSLVGLLAMVGAGLSYLILHDVVVAMVVGGLGLLLFGTGTVALLLLAAMNRPPKATTVGVVPVTALDPGQLERDSTELADRLNALGLTGWPDFEGKRVLAGKAIVQRDEARARLEGLLAPGKGTADLEAERLAASKKRRDCEEQLAVPNMQRASELSAVQYQAISSEIVRLTKEEEDLDEEAAILRARLEEAAVSREDLLRGEERLAAVHLEFERAKERLATYEFTLECLKVAREKTLLRAQDQLGPLAGSYLDVLSNGRYSELIVDPELNVSIPSPSKATGPVSPDELSKGTQDQLYVALRLGLAAVLFPKANPPLLLDDPFVKFDPKRRKAAVVLCQRVAESRQVMLFTCSDDFDDAGHLIEIGG